ncbi:DUF3040 domain-containing protein [Actinobacteria bacterium IMCC25003]|nr:DUF3040 domain-containing protein [Actinobacteria bacterium IMCC25003]
MPLSDRERRLLAEMEAALATDDPRLESRLGGSTLTPARPRILLGVSLTLLGIAIIFGGLISKTTPIGVLGFLVALVGVLALIRSVGAIGTRTARPKGARKSLGDRLQERWDRRNFQ